MTSPIAPVDLHVRRVARATVDAIERLPTRDQATAWEALERMRDGLPVTDGQLPILRRLHMATEAELGEPCRGPCTICERESDAHD